MVFMTHLSESKQIRATDTLYEKKLKNDFNFFLLFILFSEEYTTL